MFVSLVAALTAAFCYGIGAVMQAIAVRAASRRPVLAAAGVTGRVDPGLVIRMFRQWPFVLSLGIDFIGFVCQLIALRRLPIFEVQVIIAGNLAVTAVFASWLMHTVLSLREWAAVIAIVVGVGLLGSSAGSQGATSVGIDFHLGLIAALAAIALAGMGAARLPSQYRTVALGATAGLGYAVLAVCARILPGFTPEVLIKSPAAYTLAAAGIISFMLYASALESGSVTVATAAVILLETAPPALIGVLFLGDSTRPGQVAPAIAGFIMALVSAVALARFGEAGVQKGTEAKRAAQAEHDAAKLARATKLRKAKMLALGSVRRLDPAALAAPASAPGPIGTVGPGGPNGAEADPGVTGQVVNRPATGRQVVDLPGPAGQTRGQAGLPSGSGQKTG